MLILLVMWTQKAKLIETESRTVVAEAGGKGRMLVKGYKLSVLGRINSGDLIYGMEIIFNI